MVAKLRYAAIGQRLRPLPEVRARPREDIGRGSDAFPLGLGL